VRERAIETKCVGIQLVPNATNANGKFKNGYECVHRSTLPKVCLDYFKDVPECETQRRLNDGYSDTTEFNWIITYYTSNVVNSVRPNIDFTYSLTPAELEPRVS
jgi:hypothetical protein